MRSIFLSLLIGCVSSSVISARPAACHADPSPPATPTAPANRTDVNHQDAVAEQMAIRRATRNVEIAKLRLRHYVSTEYRFRLKQLDSEVTIAKAEIHLLRKRVDAYRYVSHRDRNDYGSPTTVNIKQMELALLAAELHFEQIKAERTSLIDNDRSRRRLLKLEIEAALDELESLRPVPPETKTIRNYRNAA